MEQFFLNFAQIDLFGIWSTLFWPGRQLGRAKKNPCDLKYDFVETFFLQIFGLWYSASAHSASPWPDQLSIKHYSCLNLPSITEILQTLSSPQAQIFKINLLAQKTWKDLLRRVSTFWGFWQYWSRTNKPTNIQSFSRRWSCIQDKYTQKQNVFKQNSLEFVDKTTLHSLPGQPTQWLLLTFSFNLCPRLCQSDRHSWRERVLEAFKECVDLYQQACKP